MAVNTKLVFKFIAVVLLLIAVIYFSFTSPNKFIDTIIYLMYAVALILFALNMQ